MKSRHNTTVGWFKVILIVILLVITGFVASSSNPLNITFAVKSSHHSEILQQSFSFPRLQSGWPQKTGGLVDSSPTIGDIDGDGDLEIVIGSNDKKIYVWNPDGSLVDGWPVETGLSIRNSPALGDIDGDTDLEIVVGSMDGFVYAWHHNASLVNGWPIQFFEGDIRQPPHSGRTSSPALGDMDNDGILDIVIGTHQGPVYIPRQ